MEVGFGSDDEAPVGEDEVLNLTDTEELSENDDQAALEDEEQEEEVDKQPAGKRRRTS